jgi:hypothetical protein
MKILALALGGLLIAGAGTAAAVAVSGDCPFGLCSPTGSAPDAVAVDAAGDCCAVEGVASEPTAASLLVAGDMKSAGPADGVSSCCAPKCADVDEDEFESECELECEEEFPACEAPGTPKAQD